MEGKVDDSLAPGGEGDSPLNCKIWLGYTWVKQTLSLPSTNYPERERLLFFNYFLKTVTRVRSYLDHNEPVGNPGIPPHEATTQPPPKIKSAPTNPGHHSITYHSQLNPEQPNVGPIT